MKGKELFERILEECESKRFGDFGETGAGHDALCNFTAHDSTDGTILKVKYIEWGEAALNGEKFRLNGKSWQVEMELRSMRAALSTVAGR